MNAPVARFNRTIQDDWSDWHLHELKDPDVFNRSLMDYLIFYNTLRVHHAFKNKLSPMQCMLPWQAERPIILNMPKKSRIGWGHTTT